MKIPFNPYLVPSSILIPAMAKMCDIRDTADEAAGENTVELYAIAAEDFLEVGDRLKAALSKLADLMEEWEEEAGR